MKLGLDRAGDLVSYEYDSTGTFHWCRARDLDCCLVSRQVGLLAGQLMDMRQEVGRMVLNSHVVVCIFADYDSPLIGLRNLIMPLRASNLRSGVRWTIWFQIVSHCRYHELKHVAIVGNADYVAREWDSLSNLPRISVLHGSPMCRADLRSVNINLCDLCIILSARVPAATDPGMADKVGYFPFQQPFTNLVFMQEAILATLNINAMTFNTDLAEAGLEERGGEVYGARVSQVVHSELYNAMHIVGVVVYRNVNQVLTEVVNDSNIQASNHQHWCQLTANTWLLLVSGVGLTPDWSWAAVSEPG